MTSNLLRPLWRCALAGKLLCLALPLSAQGPCPPDIGAQVTHAWTLYRADSIALAEQLFAGADSSCPSGLDAKVGLGYASLRLGRTARADSIFRRVVDVDPKNGDGWDGLAHSAYRLGDTATALRAARNAIQLNPANPDLRQFLATLDPDWDRPPLKRPTRPATLRVQARTHGERFEVPSGRGWQPFYVKGVNLGVALPGKFPSEFPLDSALYADWFDSLGAMHANVLRLYTILPPMFYRALRGWNLSHPRGPLWLVHGVWTELPPEHDFEDPEWKEQFRQEMRRVVDLLHGAAEIPVRPGHAGGRYDADVSRWTLAYIIGREWEPFAVTDFDAHHPGAQPYQGRYLRVTSGPAMDRWMAAQCDYLLAYEVDGYNAIRPIAYTNWPTLDPLMHVTEATGAEERVWRARVGHPVPADALEYDNDAIGLDAMLVRPTPRNPAGWFASYHAYPYYPDFMLYDPGYATARSSEGPSNYFGYLHALKAHHAGLPLLISEYGVPSSRGMAHLQPQGWNHGGHDEREMAAIDARLTREIRESGAAGGIIFAWIDEWFKKNWIVIDYEIPLENTRQWHNLMDAEQNYGILGMYAGDRNTRPVLGGDPGRWRALERVGERGTTAAGAPTTLHMGNDESYVYLALELAGLAGASAPWDSLGVRIALDTYRRDLGQERLPDGLGASEVGFEFLAEFRSPEDAELRVTPEYNLYVGADSIVDGDDYGRFAHRPVTITQRADGRFDSLFVITNRARFTRDGRFIPASGYNRGRLRFGSEDRSSLSDWYYDERAGLLEVRLVWGLLNVTDPSTGTVIFEQRADSERGIAHTDGFRVGVVTYKKGTRPSLIGALPAFDDRGSWSASTLPSWSWRGWSSPRYFYRFKPVYDSLRALWAGW